MATDIKEEGKVESDMEIGGELDPAVIANLAAVISSTTTISPESMEAPENERESTKSLPGLRDWAKIVQMSGRFSEVSLEQLERVRVMHDRFDNDARFSFNYNALMFVAAALAGLGLVSNSSATIIASMLVSPIMGPVVGMAYGATIFDRRLVWRAFRTEVISLVFCVVLGAVIGACTGATYLSEDWPTPEMTTRGSLQNFLVGLPVAFFSGLGVAVSLLDDQTNSLVGVAISASLLPPAVNCGILFVAHAFVEGGVINSTSPVVTVPYNGELVTLQVVNSNNDNRPFYDSSDFYGMALMSLFLTLANIILVCLASILMFRIKEVLPIKKKVFWNDLSVARKIYQNKAIMTGPVPGISGLESIPVVGNNTRGQRGRRHTITYGDINVQQSDDEVETLRRQSSVFALGLGGGTNLDLEAVREE